ncbi:TaqI-like C-terminal specificity domain-containing protein [Mucilaginibacter sp. FT3.2]|uniref:TaqI-like C-terminal specificity domain-containing protein n=1 Tax=Mucilaginibacter sp. FT3.2 TaxID=2723090 RepID=UPI003B002B43
MSVYISQRRTVQKGFKAENGWIILSALEAEIKNKIERVGTPLKDWDINIYRGILTGYNEAFIIDQNTRDILVASSPKNAEIIRPILSGKNIKRYQFNWDNKWIIFTRKGIDIEKYPVIKAHLEAYYSSLRPRNNNESTGRKPGPYKWFEIQDNVAYYKDFEKQKIAWGNLALKGQFALVDAGYYINAPSSFIATDQVYLIAILNSKLADFYIKQLGVTRNGGYFEYKPMFVEQLPVPDISFDDQEKLLKLLNISKINNDQSIELQIDQFVYQMYGLTNDEIGYINNIKFRKIQ